VFAAPVFAGHLFESATFLKTLTAFFVFSGLSGATYLINDVADLESDRKHPWKKFRPLASGDLSVFTALTVAFGLSLAALGAAFIVSPVFTLVCLTYLALQISYSLALKRIVVLDIFALAAGYILRVYGGEFATGWHISVWLLLTVISASLFLAVGKRRAELSVLQVLDNFGETRKTLLHYSEQMLDVYLSMFANATWLTYAIFTFFEQSTVRLKPSLVGIFLDLFPWGVERKWMMATIPVVMYGIMRYIQVAYTQEKGEAPERIFLSDRPLMFTVFLWAAMVLTIIYGLGRR
jgi:4-hydroxybenzoate polyprenyltransferase